MAKRKYVKENNSVKAINTDSLELQKPLINEYYDINVHNSNMDKIDKGYKQNKNDISNINYELSKTENTKYSTESGVKEFSCKDGYVDNVVIEGETLVNLMPTAVSELNEDGNLFVIYPDNQKGLNYNRISNGTYTLFNLSQKKVAFEVADIGGYSNYLMYNVDENSCKVVSISNTQRLYSCIGSINHFETLDKFKQDCRVVILEGDHTDKPISYFEGLKSVGQGDKIEVLTHNEVSNSVTILESMCAVGKYVGANGELESVDNEWCATDFIEIKDNYIDFGSYNNPIDYWSTCFYDENKKFISNLRGGIGSSFDNVKPKDAKFLRTSIKTGFSSTDIRFCNKIDKKQIPTTLRSLPNGIKDTIEKRGNKYVKVQRCGEVVLDGSNGNISLDSQVNDTTIKPIISEAINDAKVGGANNNNLNIYCDKFKAKNIHSSSNTDEGIYYSGGLNIHIRVLKSRLSTQDAEGFKTWLKSNPVTVVYELETPIITELPNFNPQTYSDNTTLIVNSGVIQAEADFEVTNSLGSEIEVLKDKLSDIYDYVDRELVSEAKRLKNILISKNIEIMENECKLPNLIDKVDLLGEYDNPILYLYNEGDECVDITGGWADGYVYGNGTSLTKGNDYIETRVTVASNTRREVRTSNTIDFTNYSKIHFEGEFKQRTDGAYTSQIFLISDGTNYSKGWGGGASSFLLKNECRLEGNLVHTLDISNITGNHRLFWGVDSGSPVPNYSKIYKIWLEV